MAKKKAKKLVHVDNPPLSELNELAKESAANRAKAENAPVSQEQADEKLVAENKNLLDANTALLAENKELTAANEELTSANEELTAANEELTAANED